MLTRLFVFAAISLFATSAFAQGYSFTKPNRDNSGQTNQKKFMQKARAKALAYAHAVSCSVGDEIAIVPLVPHVDITQEKEAAYLAIWTGDIGCLGGSGTTVAQFAVVRFGLGDSAYVDATVSEPNVRVDLPIYGVDRVVSHTEDTIIVEGLEGDEDDAACCPTVKVHFTLKRDAKWNWKLVSKKAVGKVKQQ